MDENIEKKSKWADRSFVVLICWIALFLLIFIASAIFVMKARSGYDKYAPQNNVIDENYLFVQIPSSLVQGVVDVTVLGALMSRAICLIAIILLQIIPVIIKARKVKKAFTILNCVLNLLVPVIIIIPLIFIGTTGIIVVLTMDIGLSIGLMTYVATWKYDKE